MCKALRSAVFGNMSTESDRGSKRRRVVVDTADVVVEAGELESGAGVAVKSHEPEGRCLFHMRSVQASAFRHLFEILGNFLVDVNLILTDEGVEIRTMDSSMVAMAHAVVRKASLEKFELTKDVVVGVNISQLNSIFRSVTNKDHINIYILQSHPNILHICVENVNKTLHFEYKLLDIEETIVSLPNIAYDYKIQIGSSELNRHLRDVSAIGDEVEVKVKGSTSPKMTMCTIGDYASVTLELNQIADTESHDFSDFEAHHELREGEEINCVFPLKYLLTFSRACSLSPSAIVLVKKEFPIIIQYQFCEMGRLSFIVAPKVKEL